MQKCQWLGRGWPIWLDISSTDVVEAGDNVEELIDDFKDNERIEQFKWNDTEDLTIKEVCTKIKHAKAKMGGQLR